MVPKSMKSPKGKKTGNGAEPASFPLRVACVDMGSNAIRFLAAEFSDETEYTVLASERRAVRLGHSVFLSGVLLESWTLKQKANLFSKLFDRKISLRFLGEEQPIEKGRHDGD